MTRTATAKLRQRAERAEGMALGMGFLLLKLKPSLGEYGVGINEQVDQAIADYRRLSQAVKDRRDGQEREPTA